jgi:type IV secretory pathway VirB2 component (pilin)
MSILKNLKDPITDLIGLVIMIFTLLQVYRGEVQWLWEGAAGMGIGAVFFMFPDELIIEGLRKIIDKFSK